MNYVNRTNNNVVAAPKEESVRIEHNSQYDHIEPIQAKPLEVVVQGYNADKAMKIFRAMVQRERVLSTYKEKQTYEKPSDKKRRKRNERARKLLELAAKEDKYEKFDME